MASMAMKHIKKMIAILFSIWSLEKTAQRNLATPLNKRKNESPILKPSTIVDLNR